MMEKLWGDNYFDPSTKKWTKKHTGTASCKRGFVQFVYEPIKTIIDACMNDNKAKLWAMTDKLAITGKLKAEDKELVGKPLMKRIMQSWLPAHEVPRHPCKPWQPGSVLSARVTCSTPDCACLRCLSPGGSPCTRRGRLVAVHASLLDAVFFQSRYSQLACCFHSLGLCFTHSINCRLHSHADLLGCRLCWR